MKVIKNILLLLFWPLVKIYKWLTKKRIVERFERYEDITSRTNAEVNKLADVADDMPPSLLSYRIRTLTRIERQATKNYYTPPASGQMDVWIKPLKPPTADEASTVTAEPAQTQTEAATPPVAPVQPSEEVLTESTPAEQPTPAEALTAPVNAAEAEPAAPAQDTAEPTKAEPTETPTQAAPPRPTTKRIIITADGLREET